MCRLIVYITTTQPLFYICKLKCDKEIHTVHVFSYPEKDLRAEVCREGKFQKWVFRNGQGTRWEPMFFREPGSPLSSFVFTDPITAPCSMASRGATNHNTTILTHRPHRTRVYYHTTILQPNTVNRDNRDLEMLRRQGKVRGRRTGKSRRRRRR